MKITIREIPLVLGSIYKCKCKGTSHWLPIRKFSRKFFAISLCISSATRGFSLFHFYFESLHLFPISIHNTRPITGCVTIHTLTRPRDCYVWLRIFIPHLTVCFAIYNPILCIHSDGNKH